MYTIRYSYAVGRRRAHGGRSTFTATDGVRAQPKVRVACNLNSHPTRITRVARATKNTRTLFKWFVFDRKTAARTVRIFTPTAARVVRVSNKIPTFTIGPFRAVGANVIESRAHTVIAWNAIKAYAHACARAQQLQQSLLCIVIIRLTRRRVYEYRVGCGATMTKLSVIAAPDREGSRVGTGRTRVRYPFFFGVQHYGGGRIPLLLRYSKTIRSRQHGERSKILFASA